MNNNGFVCCIFLLFIVGLRGAPPTCPSEVQIAETPLDGEVLDIAWVTGRTTVVFVITDQYTLYRSNDGGKSWASQRGILGGSVTDLYPTVDQQHVYLLGRQEGSGKTNFYGTALWLASSSSADYVLTTFSNDDAVFALTTHPTLSQYVLAETFVNYRSSVLRVSNNWGKTFSQVSASVSAQSFEWGSGSVVWYVEYNPTQLDYNWTLYSTPDWGTTRIEQMHGVFGIALVSDVLFVGKISDFRSLASHLYTGREYGTNGFTRALFPIEVDENSYSLIDVSQGSIFINVRSTTDTYTGTIFSSDSIGKQFVLSLANNLVETTDGRTHFQKVHSVPGVHLANVEDGTSRSPNSVITFNNGATWQPIRAPTVDMNGQPIQCQGSCNLQLHMAPSSANSAYHRAYSIKEAVGLIIANGNVGASLADSSDQVQTYMSTNAGWDWVQVSDTSSVFGFADHGSLTMMGDSEDSTTTIKYSWNEGKTFSECAFTSSPLYITSIEIVDLARCEAFGYNLTFTRNGVRNQKAVLVHFDFSNFHERQCQDSDYEDWSPTDDQIGKGCFLGQNITYRRKIPDAECFNPINHDVIESTTPCGCRSSDYECDFCYQLYKGVCVPVCPNESRAYQPPVPCYNSYNLSRGYRLIPGDQCNPSYPNLNLLPFDTPCPYQPAVTTTGATGGSGGVPPKGPSNGGTAAALIIVFVIFGAIVLGLVFAWRRGYLDQCLRTKRKSRYGRLPGDEEVFFNEEIEDDDDVDNLGTDAPVLNDEAIKSLHESNSTPE